MELGGPHTSHFSSSATGSTDLMTSRVAQLDADLLDTELETTLLSPLQKAMDLLSSRHRNTLEPELMALVKLAVLKLSFWDDNATYGLTLQNMRYRDISQRKKILYMLLSVAPSYLNERLKDLTMLSNGWADDPLPSSARDLFCQGAGRFWRRIAYEAYGWLERVLTLLNLLQLLAFLYRGNYRNLVDRILNLKVFYTSKSTTRNVNFDYQNRELVWETITEFMLFTLPLLNLRKIELRLQRRLKEGTQMIRSRFVPSTEEKESTDEKPQGPFAFLPLTTCPICYEQANLAPQSLATHLNLSGDPTLSGGTHAQRTVNSSKPTELSIPYEAQCGCRYCYYCIVPKLVAAQEEGYSEWDCIRCGQGITSVWRYAGGTEGDYIDEKTEKDILSQGDEDVTGKKDHETSSITENPSGQKFGDKTPLNGKNSVTKKNVASPASTEEDLFGVDENKQERSAIDTLEELYEAAERIGPEDEYEQF